MFSFVELEWVNSDRMKLENQHFFHPSRNNGSREQWFMAAETMLVKKQIFEGSFLFVCTFKDNKGNTHMRTF